MTLLTFLFFFFLTSPSKATREVFFRPYFIKASLKSEFPKKPPLDHKYCKAVKTPIKRKIQVNDNL